MILDVRHVDKSAPLVQEINLAHPQTRAGRTEGNEYPGTKRVHAFCM